MNEIPDDLPKDVTPAAFTGAQPKLVTTARNGGLPVLPTTASSRPVTPELVNQLREGLPR